MSKSHFHSKHQRQNWFVGVDLVALAEKTDSVINPSDVRFETFGASGPGGQHANKKLALTLLRDKISQENQSARNDDARAQRQQHEQLERGNPVKVFSGIEFKEKR